jgi:hypothetical protein
LISSSGNSILENDVLFNTANKFNSFRGTTTEAGTAGFVDLHRVALHELGHVLGLDHPDEKGQKVVAIMNAFVSTTDSLRRMMSLEQSRSTARRSIRRRLPASRRFCKSPVAARSRRATTS